MLMPWGSNPTLITMEKELKKLVRAVQKKTIGLGIITIAITCKCGFGGILGFVKEQHIIYCPKCGKQNNAV